MLNKKGFTLIEMVVVLAVIAVLAAILTPSITRYIENARAHRAESDCKAIAAAIAKFNADVGEWPIWVSGMVTGYGDTSYDVLISSGEEVAQASGVTGWVQSGSTVDELDNQLNENTPAYDTAARRRKWSGPYLPDLSEDPWGNKYLVNVETLEPGGTKNAVFVLSAGQDEEISTLYSQNAKTAALSGDDIWCRIR
ncbi:MAG: type II secretion system protein GspG [Candidatus Latescibacterota bacterium]